MRSFIIFHCNFDFFKNTRIQNSPPTTPDFWHPAECKTTSTVCLTGNVPTTVSMALAESWSRVVFMMQVYVPSSPSVTSLMVRLSVSTTNLITEDHRGMTPFYFPTTYITGFSSVGMNSNESLVSLTVFVPLIIRQLSAVFEPGHGGHEGWVVFDFTFEGGAHSSLNYLVLRLLQDAGGLWKMVKIKEHILINNKA